MSRLSDTRLSHSGQVYADIKIKEEETGISDTRYPQQPYTISARINTVLLNARFNGGTMDCVPVYSKQTPELLNSLLTHLSHFGTDLLHFVDYNAAVPSIFMSMYNLGYCSTLHEAVEEFLKRVGFAANNLQFPVKKLDKVSSLLQLGNFLSILAAQPELAVPCPAFLSPGELPQFNFRV